MIAACKHDPATRFESVRGIPNLYVDHKSRGCPYVLRFKRDGRTIQETLGVMSRADAILRRDQFFAKTITVRPQGPVVRCEDAFEQWFTARTSSGHRRPFAVSTAKRYRGLWDNHAKAVLGRKKVREVTVEDIVTVFDAMREKGLDPNNAYVMLSAFFKAMTLKPYQHRADNPVQMLGELKPAAPSSDAVSEDAVVTREELEQIILAIPSKTAIDKHVRQTLIRLSYLSGLRLSEVLGLTWDTIDLDEGEIHVTRQLAINFKAGEPTTWFGMVKGNKTKVGSTARVVPLSDEAWALLREYRGWVLANGLWRGQVGLVFTTKKHTPIHQSSIGEVFAMAVDRGFRAPRYKWTFHCLRHSYASIEFALGTSVEEVARLLGHSSDVTKKRYIHLVDRVKYNEAYRARRRAQIAAV